MKNIKDIKFYLLDMDGTIYLGNKLFDCTIPFLNLLEEQGKRYIFLTNNSSKNRNVYVEKLAKMGITAKPDDVFTSGEATTIYLNKIKPDARIYLCGTPSLEHEFEEAGFTLTDKEPDYVVLGFDMTLTYEKLVKLCDFVRDGLPYIVTHPDFNCPVEGGFIPDTGSMMALVKASTRRDPDLVIGKPNKGIVDAIVEKYHANREEICMVGDRLYTDIALGAKAGIISILVLSGETSMEDLEKSDVEPSFIFDDLTGIAEAIK